MTAEEKCSLYVAKMDAAVSGQRGIPTTARVAYRIIEFGLDQASAMRVFSEYNARCQPPWTEHELVRKLAWAARGSCPKADFASDLTPRSDFVIPNKTKHRAWPELNIARRDAILERGFGVADLMERSDDPLPSAMDYLRILFPGNPLICCAATPKVFSTRPVAQWALDAHEHDLIVPSPMTSETGIKDDGKISARCIGNTGDRRFAVVEFDPEKWLNLPADEQARYGDEAKYAEAKLDEQAGLAIHLSGYAPLVMSVHSAGKSLHSYFFVAGEDEARVYKFYRYAVSLGADPAVFPRYHLTRMPEGTRAKGGMKLRQPVYFWKPERIKC